VESGVKGEALTLDNAPPSFKDFIPFYLPFVIVSIMFYIDYQYQNPFIVVWLAYVLIPILDYSLPIDHYNLPESRIRLFEKDKRFLIPLYLAWTLDFAIYFALLYLVSSGKIAQTPVSFVIYVVSYA